MKTSDVVITVGALGAMGVIGYFGYTYYLAQRWKDVAVSPPSTTTTESNIPGASEKFTILPGGDVTPAKPGDITNLPCATGYYKTAALAMQAFLTARGLTSLSGTWRYEFAPDSKECWRVASVLTREGEMK